MAVPSPRYTKDECARRGGDRYERNVRPHAEVGYIGKFVVIDIGTGDYEIDENEVAALDRLLARRPGARVWVPRVGLRSARRFGPRARPAPV